MTAFVLEPQEVRVCVRVRRWTSLLVCFDQLDTRDVEIIWHESLLQHLVADRVSS